MLKAIHCNPSEHTFHHVKNMEEAGRIKDDKTSILWLDLLNPSEDDLTQLKKDFQLHPLAIEDASHEHQRPKVEEYENFYFLVFYTVHLNPAEQEMEIHEIDMFLGDNFLVTVHTKPMPELDELEQRWTRNVRQLEWGVGVLLYTLLDAIVDRYFPVVDELVEQAESLEDEMFGRKINQATFTQQLLMLKKRFLTLRRIATPERDVLNVLTNRDNTLFDEHAQIYFRDVYDHITRLADTIDLYRDQLSSTIDANLSLVSNDLNKVMRTLTSASIILMVDSLLAGIWGMNFDNMPELHLPLGYFGALALMVALSVGMLAIFRRIRWF